MKNRLVLFVALLPLFFASAAPCVTQPSISVEIVNNSGLPPGSVYVLLTGDPSYPITVSGIEADNSTPLTSLSGNQFTLSAITTGRITISYGASVPANQQPIVASPRFDKVELTYPGAANLTAVDFFGIPFKLETLDASGNVLEKLTFYTSANSLNGILSALAPSAAVNTTPSLGGTLARILSPALSPLSYPSMQPYVNSVKNHKVTISGTYVGQIQPSPNTYSYSGTFDLDGNITLDGNMTQPATPNSQPLTVAGATLASAIYTCDGNYTVENAVNNPQQVKNNDVYAAIYRDLVAGFNFGYMHGRYGSNSASWYGTTPYHPPYACARTNDGYFNQYASIISANSDAYGFPFADVNQLVQVGLNDGETSSVATLRITILPDDMLDAPIIQSISSDNSSITVSWNPIAGATDYRLQILPHIPAQFFDAGNSTSYTISNLASGTPYTVSVSASNGNSTSEAIPMVVSTTGSLAPVTGPVTWNFVPFFTGTFPSGHTIKFNGVSQSLPTNLNPSLPFYNVQGQPGQQNAYVFEWIDGNQTVFSSVLYVQLNSSPSFGTGSIEQSASESFMAANQNMPTYDEYGCNLYLSIDPSIQRSLCTTSVLDPFPTKFGFSGSVKAMAMKGGRQLRLTGTAVDRDGLRGISVTVTTSDGKKNKKTIYPATIAGGRNWMATVRTFGSRGVLPVDVTAVDRKGNVRSKSYLVKIPTRPFCQ